MSPSHLVKQETGQNSPTSGTCGSQVSAPLSVLQSPNHMPLANPPPQDDLWHLPGRLRINPSLWDKEDVSLWLHWAQKEYSLRRPEKGRFEMNGRALCLLTKEDFRRRCPSSGDVLYEILQCVKQQRRAVVCEQSNTPPSQAAGNIQSPADCQTQLQTVQKPQAVTISDNKVVTAETSLPEPRSPLSDHPVIIYKYPATLTNSTSVSTPPHNLQSRSQDPQEPLNLSNREKPRSPMHKANGRLPDCKLLWDYVYQLLCDDRYQEYIRWEDQDSQVFRVVDPNGLARLWGNHKNRENMTYEKMSRALRHYYKLNIIKKERGQKLLFRFLKLPHDNTKSLADHVESPERTPPHDEDLSGSSPAHEFRENHFEVSPDRESPQPTP